MLSENGLRVSYVLVKCLASWTSSLATIHLIGRAVDVVCRSQV